MAFTLIRRAAFLVACVLVLGALIPGSARATGKTHDLAALFAEARSEEQKGDWKAAGKLYAEYLQLSPDSPRVHANLGVVYAHEGKFDAAIAEYRSALRLNPALKSMYLNLGIAYFRKNDFVNAVPPLQKFLHFQPKSRQGMELLGLSYAQSGRFKEAIRTLSPLENTGDPGVLFALGACNVKLRRMRDAQEALRKLLMVQPNSPRIHFLLAQTYAGLHDYPLALREFSQVYQLDPRWPQIRLLMGAVQAKVGRFKEAEELLRAQVKATPQNYEANLTLGALLNKESHYAEALPFLARALEANPQGSSALYQSAFADWKLGREEDAWTNVQRAVRTGAKNRQAHYLCGQIAQARGDSKTARREFATAESLSESQAQEDVLRLSESSEKSRYF